MTMEIKIKRFMDISAKKGALIVFVGLLCLMVKGAEAKTTKDRVLSIDGPLSFSTEKNAAVVLDSLLFDAGLELTRWLKPQDPVRLRKTTDHPDRYQRSPAQVYLEDGRWLQGELVRTGQARVFSPSQNDRSLPALLKLERWARSQNLGKWSTPDWQVHSANKADMATQIFAIVRGVVIDVAEVKGVTYLNFGANWRTDFTVRIRRSAKPAFIRQGFDFPALKGVDLEVRGWVMDENGPMIEGENPLHFVIHNP